MEKNPFTLMRALFIIIVVGSHAYILPYFDGLRFVFVCTALAGFFVLAGFFSWRGLHERPYKTFAIDKIKKLYIPLVLTAFVMFFLIPVLLSNLFYNPNSQFSILKTKLDASNEFQKFVLLCLYTSSTHLWFIYVLFVIFLTFPFLLKLLDILGDSVSLIALFAVAVIFQPFNTSKDYLLYVLFGYLFFFYIGYLARKMKLDIGGLSRFGGPISLILFAISLVFLNPFDTSLLSSLFFNIVAVLGVITSYWLCSGLENWLKEKGQKILNALYYVGENSYVIYLLHHPYLYLGFISSKLAILYKNLVLLWYGLSVFAGVALPLLVLQILIRFRDATSPLLQVFTKVDKS